MAFGSLSSVTATLIADTREFSAKIDEAQAKMEGFGKTSETVGQKFTKFGNMAANAVIGAGAAIVGFSVDEAFKFQEAMDRLQNATGMTDKQIKALGQTIIQVSDLTGSSTADLATSMANIEQAGIRGAKATELMTVAAKAALATNTNVVDVTHALVAAQSLQIAKGEDIANLTGILVAGSHAYVGGLDAEVSMLQGKVGVALANYHIGLKTSIELGSVFAKIGLPTRSITSFINGLGKLEAPMTTLSTTSKGVTEKLSTYYLSLEHVGLSQAKLASDLRVGNIAGLLTQIKDAAAASHQPLSELMNVVFGATGGATGSLLANSSAAINQVQKALNGAGGNSLNKAFETASEQFGNKLHIIENNLKNSAAQFGLILMPYISDAATFIENALTSLEKHPVERKALEIDLGVTVAAAIGLKIANALQSATQVSLLGEIAANTAATAGEGGAKVASLGAAETAAGGGALLAGARAAGGIFGAAALATLATQELNKSKNVPWWDPAKLVASAVTAAAHAASIAYDDVTGTGKKGTARGSKTLTMNNKLRIIK